MRRVRAAASLSGCKRRAVEEFWRPGVRAVTRRAALWHCDANRGREICPRHPSPESIRRRGSIKMGSRSLRRDAKIHQKTFGTSGRKSGCVSRRHAARTGRRGRRTPPDHRFGPGGSASARSATAGPAHQKWPANRPCERRGAAPHRRRGSARCWPRCRRPPRGPTSARGCATTRWRRPSTAGSELRAPLPRGPDGPQPQVRHRPRHVVALGLVCLPRPLFPTS